MGIVLDNVCYKHNDGDYFFRNLSLEITYGKITGIVGKNGSGKTTFLEIIAGLKKIDSGKISKYDRKNIGIIFQFPEEQFFEKKVKDEISFALNNFNLSSKRLKEVIKIVGLKEEVLSKNIDEISSGEKRLVAIASILVYNPKILLFDEPTVGLDYKNKKKIINLIKNLKNKYNKTIVVVSHEVDMLYELCDDLIVLSRGNIILYGDCLSVYNEIDLINKYDIPIPKVVLFTNYLRREKNIKLLPCKNVNDLIKEVYRNV